MRTIFSVDDSPYLGWQSRLLARSFAAVGQPGPLVRLLSGDGPELPGMQTFRTAPFARDSGIGYPPINKPCAVLAWINATESEDEIIHLIDPDCVYVGRLGGDVHVGLPRGERIHYMGVDNPANRDIVGRHGGAGMGPVQPVGVPILMHRDDLAAVAPRWAELTFRMRCDPDASRAFGWTVEMWAFAVASAEAGIIFTLGNTQQFLHEPYGGMPIIHYSYDVPGGWSKRSYRPWEPPGSVPDGAPGTSRIFLEHLDVAAREFRGGS